MDWKKTLGDLAPTIGTAFGPLGTAGGLAIKALLGLSNDAGDDDITAALANPENQVKLKQMEYDYKNALLQQQAALAATDEKDRDSARTREASVKDNTPKILASIIVMGVMGFMACIIGGWNHATEATTGLILGYGVSELKQILAYYFGSSSSSSQKNDMIADMIKK